jgi:hypothetical protein
MFRLVAADAGERLPRVQVGGGAHRLDREAVFVERLKIKPGAGRGAEMGAAVGLHRHCAEHAAGERLGGVADVGFVLDRILLGKRLITRSCLIVVPAGQGRSLS